MHEWSFDVACGLKESPKDSEPIRSNLIFLQLNPFDILLGNICLE